MRALWVAGVVAAVLAARIWFRRRRARTQEPAPTEPPPRLAVSTAARRGPPPSDAHETTTPLADVRLVAVREVRERVRGRLFKLGTVFILLVVVAAIVIPALHHSSGPTVQTVGVVGRLSPEAARALRAAGVQSQDRVRLVRQPSLPSAERALRDGTIDVAVIDGAELVLSQPASNASAPADPVFVHSVAISLGVLRAFRAAGLTPGQTSIVAHATPIPVRALQQGTSSPHTAVSVIGLVLLFLMLTQYNTWILIGVMQEKASRVVEVLLATVRPLELLGGKVLGIGLVAMGQAALIVAEAFILSKAVGSDLLHGTGPVLILSDLLWLVLGYAFYCWVYAAAGSTAERQDQVQTLALPLSLPIIIGYVYSITVASSGNPSLLFKVLAYLPPTAPFAMPVLVGLGLVAWWQFLASVAFSLAGTAAIAWFAAGIYRRAVLRSGQRVRLSDLRPRATRRVATPV